MFYFIFDWSSMKMPSDKEELLSFYYKNKLNNKTMVMNKINEMIKSFDEKKCDFPINSVYIKLLNELYKSVENSLIPDLFNDSFWSYNIRLETNGAILYQQYTPNDGKYISKQGGYLYTYDIISAKPKYLTTKEFADIYKVKEVTVRQWIRRGKLKSIIKNGSDWKISELSIPCLKGTEDSYYSWENQLFEFDYFENFDINMFNHLSIKQIEKTQNYRFHFTGRKEYEIVLSIKEKERVELYFLGNPLVHSSNSFLEYTYF